MSNTVGSREIIPKILTARKNLVLNLRQNEFDILIGSMLGDGYITKLGRIQIEQSEKQKEYLFWKYAMLERITSTRICSVARQSKVLKKPTFSYRFWTRQFFRPWRNIFYPNGEKVLPMGIKKSLTPLALAVWFMDDGFLRKSNSIAISTDKFSDNDLQYLCKSLEDIYEIKPSIVKSKKLYFGVNATKGFIEVIKPFIIPSMRYKIP